MSLLRLATKNALANRSRFTLTLVAVVLSVAFLTATLVVADSVTGTADDNIAIANENLSLVVEGAVISEGDGGPGEALERITETLPSDAVAAVQAIAGVADVAPVSFGFTKLTIDGEAVGAGTALDVGRNWIDSPLLNPFVLVEGTAPTGPNQVVLDVALADDGGLVIGDAVALLTPVGVLEASLTGVVTFGGANQAPLQRTALFDGETAARISGEQGATRLRVLLDDDADLAQVSDEIITALPGTVVIDAASFISTEQTAVSSPFEFLSLFLLAFAVMATVAGATIIFNTLVIAIGQRRRELALLRAVGARRKDVLRTVLGESALIAIVATAIGIALGLAGAGGLRRLMDIAGLSFLDGPSIVSARTIIVASVVGLVVTIGSAWAPARRASSAAPVEALRDASTEPTASSRWRYPLGFALIAGGIVLVIAAGRMANVALLSGLALTIPGLILAGPAIITATLTVVRPALQRLAGVEGAMASTNLGRNPRRASSTSLGLTLGVAMIGFFAVVGSSLNASFQTTLGSQLRANVVVTSATSEASTIDPGLDERLKAIPEVSATAALAIAEGTVGGEAAAIGGVPAEIEELFDFGVVEGDLAALANEGIAVWTGGEGAIPAVGDLVEINLPAGSATVPVVALFDESLASFDPPSHLVSDDLLLELQPGLLDLTVFVSTESAVAHDAVRAVVAETPGSLFETRASYIAAAGAEVNALRNLIYALLGLTVIIAVVGVANTTALSISERVREIGLLRAVGATRTTIRRMIRYEAAVLALVGTLTGLALAMVGGWALIRAAGGTALSTVQIPWTALGVIGILAVSGSMLAGAVPAWRASRIPTLDAIA